MNKVTTLIRKNKQAYFKKAFTDAIIDNNINWTCIRKAIHNGTTPTKVDHIATLINPEQFVNQLNKYIAEIGTKLSKEINSHQTFVGDNRFQNIKFKFECYTEQQIVKII